VTDQPLDLREYQHTPEGMVAEPRGGYLRYSDVLAALHRIDPHVARQFVAECVAAERKVRREDSV
jgi:hypothetical protein